MSKIDKIGKVIEGLAGKIIFVLMAVLVFVVFTQVVLRYILNSSLVWAEELERMIFIWLMFLGIPLGFYKGRHFAVTAIIEKLGKYKKAVHTLIFIITIIFFVSLTWLGLEFTIDGFSAVAAVLPISLGFLYLIIPIASVMSLIFCILQFKEQRGK
jgi:TRAP-type transport system small permease protein